MERALGNHRPYFDLDGFRVIVEEQSGATPEPVAEATVRLRVKGIPEHTAASGNGPVNALDHALRKALEEFYPNLREMTLLDYKVRILDESKGTAAKTRVLDHLGRRRGDVGHGRRGRQHHRGLLAGARGLHRVQAPSRRTEGETVGPMLSLSPSPLSSPRRGRG